MTLIIEFESNENFSKIRDSLENKGYEKQNDGSLWGKDMFVRFADPSPEKISIDDFSKIYSPTSKVYDGGNSRQELVDVVKEVISQTDAIGAKDAYNHNVDLASFR